MTNFYREIKKHIDSHYVDAERRHYICQLREVEAEAEDKVDSLLFELLESLLIDSIVNLMDCRKNENILTCFFISILFEKILKDNYMDLWQFLNCCNLIPVDPRTEIIKKIIRNSVEFYDHYYQINASANVKIDLMLEILNSIDFFIRSSK